MSEFKLVSKAVPQVQKAVIYDDILKAFLKKSDGSVLVVAKKKPATLHQGLMKAKRAGDYAVKVARRGDEVYLTP